MADILLQSKALPMGKFSTQPSSHVPGVPPVELALKHQTLLPP
uniref:Uncharacterized protein n=1 Tax=Anguilla anguilla TaxID=7936 RepID=A0A0E9SED9_ANGAN